MLSAYLLAFAAAVGCTAALTPLVRRWALHLGALDEPNHRKVHSVRVPRLGGVALGGALIAALGLTCALLPAARALVAANSRQIVWLFLGAAVVCFTGVLDDTRGLSATLKLQLQVVAALMAYWGGSQLRLVEGGGVGFHAGAVLNLAASVFWIATLTNSINLIDGLDGLAAGITTIVVLLLGVLSHAAGFTATSLLSMMVAGIAVGFLPFNFHPARIFLGDSGSFLLGYLLAALSMQLLEQRAPFSSLAVLIILFSVPLLDLVLAIVRRLFKGQDLFVADGNHIHHRLLGRGWGHARSVMVLWGTTLLFGGLALLLGLAVRAQDRLALRAVAVLLLVVAVVNFGGSEIRQALLGLRFVRDRRRQSPRERTLRVRLAARGMVAARDAEGVRQVLAGLARDIDLDLLDVELTLDGPVRTPPLSVCRIERPDPRRPADLQSAMTAVEITATRLRGPGGVSGTVKVGKERWKRRRQSEEDRLWTTLLAQGVLDLDESVLAAIRTPPPPAPGAVPARLEAVGVPVPVEPVFAGVPERMIARAGAFGPEERS